MGPLKTTAGQGSEQFLIHSVLVETTMIYPKKIGNGHAPWTSQSDHSTIAHGILWDLMGSHGETVGELNSSEFRDTLMRIPSPAILDPFRVITVISQTSYVNS